LFKKLFNTPYFVVSTVHDVEGVELCGALKNIVAIAAGVCDGLGLGGNTKAAVMRLGLMEMKRFSQMCFPGVPEHTFLESCGVADLITTCYGGRNRKVAEAFAKTGKPFEELEKEMLDGQKLQGTGTSKDIHLVLKKMGKVDQFPLFYTVYKMAYEGLQAKDMIAFFEKGAALDSD
jgi:glycerol-3-phosphate dehydrogenase (NAD+)